VENLGADWPLSRKFGTTIDGARDLMLQAGVLGMDPYGLSFHVGSQQTTTSAYEVAIGKAYASVAMGAASRVLLQRAKENPQFFGALSATAHGKFLPQTGAVLIKDKDGNILGAAGASGGTGDEDEAACIAGIAAAGLVSG